MLLLLPLVISLGALLSMVVKPVSLVVLLAELMFELTPLLDDEAETPEFEEALLVVLVSPELELVERLEPKMESSHVGV